MERFFARHDFNAAAADVKLSHRRFSCFALLAVAGAAQISDDLCGGELVTFLHNLRTGVYLGCIAEDLPRHAAIDDALVLDVEEGEGRHEQDSGDEETGNHPLHDGIADGEVVSAPALRFARARWPLRSGARPGFGHFDFDCHVNRYAETPPIVRRPNTALCYPGGSMLRKLSRGTPPFALLWRKGG